MGDVFDAMNRAKRQGAAPSSAGPEPTPRRDQEQGDLPIQEVEQAASTPTAEAAAGAAAPAGPVAAAVDRARQAQPEPAAVAPYDPQANGYSPEVIVHYDRGGVITEQYRAIRTQVLARCKNRRLQVHVVTSAAPEEGKSITSLNLGLAFAELRNQRILLLEGDLRRPSFESYLGHAFVPGLIQFLRDEVRDIDQVLHPTAYENLQILPAGGHEAVHSTELLSSPRMAQLIDRLRDRYDFVFVDTPPVITVTDPCIMGALADQTILVVRLNKTPSEVIDRAKRLLRAANCDLAGVILTHLEPDISRYLYRDAYYSRYYGRYSRKR